jgi:hypothetical protein
MCVLPKMAIDAVHSLLEMNVVKVNGFFKSLWIVRRDNVVLRVKQVSFSITLEHLPEHPAVAV